MKHELQHKQQLPVRLERGLSGAPLPTPTLGSSQLHAGYRRSSPSHIGSQIKIKYISRKTQLVRLSFSSDKPRVSYDSHQELPLPWKVCQPPCTTLPAPSICLIALQYHSLLQSTCNLNWWWCEKVEENPRNPGGSPSVTTKTWAVCFTLRRPCSQTCLLSSRVTFSASLIKFPNKAFLHPAGKSWNPFGGHSYEFQFAMHGGSLKNYRNSWGCGGWQCGTVSLFSHHWQK